MATVEITSVPGGYRASWSYGCSSSYCSEVHGNSVHNHDVILPAVYDTVEEAERAAWEDRNNLFPD